MAAGPDGSVYVGDNNYIRRIGPEGKATTIVVFGRTQVSEIVLALQGYSYDQAHIDVDFKVAQIIVG